MADGQTSNATKESNDEFLAFEVFDRSGDDRDVGPLWREQLRALASGDLDQALEAQDELDAWDEAHDAFIGRVHAVAVASGKQRAPGNLTTAQWVRIQVQFDHCCAYCGKQCNTLHLDHVVPVSKGGRTDADNVLPACQACNLSKSDDDVEAFLRRSGLAHRIRQLFQVSP